LKRPQDLGRFKLIHYELPVADPDAVPTWAHWLQAVGIKGVDPARGLRLNVADHALDAAAEGAGVVLAYKVIAAGDIRAGRLVSPFGPELPIVGRAYQLVFPAGHERQHKISAFRDWLLAEIAQFRTQHQPAPRGIRR
jgi:LysR family glycine cleavage system transcriptional activator